MIVTGLAVFARALHLAADALNRAGDRVRGAACELYGRGWRRW